MLTLLMAVMMTAGAVAGRDTSVAAFDEAPAIRSQAPITYPAEAKKEGVEGKVFLMLTIDRTGKVTKAEVTKGVRSDLDKAALESARQWTFTPARKKGEPVEATVAVPVSFKLEEKGGKQETVKETAAPKGEGDVVPVRTVNPAYPEGAKKRGVEGTVYVEATIDRSGRVAATKVLRGVDPELDAAAVEALRQWTFKPPSAGGDDRRIQVVIPVRFKLSDEEKKK